MSGAKAALLERESEIDAEISALPIVEQLPVRALIASLHVLVHTQLQAEAGVDAQLRGYSLVGRLSYLVPMLEHAPREPFGTDAADALQGHLSIDPDGSQLTRLVTYGHFCEVMPEIRRNYYVVTADGGQFRLVHGEGVGDAELRDILYTDLSLPFGLNPASADLDAAFDRLARTAPVFDQQGMLAIYRSLRDFYAEVLFERALINDQGFTAATGSPREAFMDFRSACWAIADFCIGVERALHRRLAAEGKPADLEREWLEWVSVNWLSDFLTELIAELSGLSVRVTRELLGFFTFDLNDAATGAAAGDGFLPPFARLRNSFLFSPYLVRLFLLERNILFTINRSDRQRFDDFVSQHLEPQLIGQARAVLERLAGVETRIGHHWRRGEIDLLAYDARTNVALQIQAKAALPPQGARMVSALESRSLEGLEQLERFRSLGEGERNDELSRAFGRPLAPDRLDDLLLTNSGLGSARGWAAAANVHVANLQLLALAADQAGDLGELGPAIEQIVTELIRTSAAAWVERELNLESLVIRVPMLEYDASQAARLRIRAWQLTTE